jgi:CRP/FNR family transcriptional regulator
VRYDPSLASIEGKRGGIRPPRCLTCPARAAALCRDLGDEQIAALHAIGRRRTFPRGQVVTWQGDPATLCANLVSGVLKVSRGDADGREQIVGLLFPGDFVGDLFAETATDTIATVSDADLCFYPRPALESLLERDPMATRLLLMRATRTLAETRNWVLLLGRRSAQEKVATFLLEMSRRLALCGTDVSAFSLPISRTGIGDALGLTIETVSRQITALKEAGAIALPGGRRVVIVDRRRLTDIAGG